MEKKKCRVCGKELSLLNFYPHRNICKKCYYNQKRKRSLKYISSGKCYDCGKPIDYSRSLYYCGRCLNERNKAKQKLKEKRKEQGICISCGKRQIDYNQSSIYCSECLNKRRESRNRYKNIELNDLIEIKKYLEISYESSKS